METQFNQYVALKGSFKPAPQATPTDDTTKSEQITVTIRVKPKKPLPDVMSGFKSLSREEFHKEYGASEEDLEKVTEFAAHYGLSLVKVDANARTVKVQGTLQQMEDAFRTAVSKYKDKEGCVFRARIGELQVPLELTDVIEGVFGLDNRQIATPKFRVRNKGQIVHARQVNTSYTGNQLARIYDYPADVSGKGQCIAIIELGGGYKTADITKYFKSLNITKPKVKAISVDGGHNSPSTPDSADGEVLLDIEVAGAVAPGAMLAVYFAPNTDSGFLNAITQAVHDTRYKPSVISISWGSAESNWTEQALQAYNQAFQEAAAMGVTVCAAAGDSGSNDGVNDGEVHVDFPASSPYVLACGGTRLNVSGSEITEEVVWHASDDSATGGGVSEIFPLPDYQSGSNVPVSLQTKKPGRGVPDVAAVADPATGYDVLVDGESLVIGGTSAVAPLMAGLIALINEKLQKPSGFIHTKLYASAAACRDITEGDNITVTGNKGYKAGKGWDACTGMGVPVGSKLLEILK
jgi:kumamolisin